MMAGVDIVVAGLFLLMEKSGKHYVILPEHGTHQQFLKTYPNGVSQPYDEAHNLAGARLTCEKDGGFSPGTLDPTTDNPYGKILQLDGVHHGYTLRDVTSGSAGSNPQHVKTVIELQHGVLHPKIKIKYNDKPVLYRYDGQEFSNLWWGLGVHSDIPIQITIRKPGNKKVVIEQSTGEVWIFNLPDHSSVGPGGAPSATCNQWAEITHYQGVTQLLAVDAPPKLEVCTDGVPLPAAQSAQSSPSMLPEFRPFDMSTIFCPPATWP